MWGRLFAIVSGIVFLTVFAVLYAKDSSENVDTSNWQEVSGEVVKLEVKRERVSNRTSTRGKASPMGYRAEISYCYNYDGHAYDGKLQSKKAENTPARAKVKIKNLKIGQSINLLVNPEQPRQSVPSDIELDSKYAQMVVACVFCAIGIMLISIGIFVR